MRRNRSLAVGVLCGLCCMVCVGAYVTMADARAQAAGAEALASYGGEQVEVCVAARDIAAGETLDESCIETRTWVAALLPAGAVTDGDEALGRQVGSSILAGEVISSKRFGVAVSELEIPDGLTAVSVPARDVQAVGGALGIGMRADVYAVGSTSTAKLVSQALIVATSAGDDASSSISWVTLAGAPERVEEIVSAAQNLELYFVPPSTSGEQGELERDVVDGNSEDTSAEEVAAAVDEVPAS